MKSTFNNSENHYFFLFLFFVPPVAKLRGKSICWRVVKSSRGMFVKSPETFRVYFGATIAFLSSQRRGSKPPNFVFLVLKTCKRISFSKQADCSLTTSLSGPKSSRDFRETDPWGKNIRGNWNCWEGIPIKTIINCVFPTGRTQTHIQKQL